MKLWKNLKGITGALRNKGIKGALNYARRRSNARKGGYPHTIVFESAAVCNLRCEFCYIYRNPVICKRKFLPFETFKKVVDETEFFLEEASLHWRGEPLLNNDLVRMIAYASKKNIESSFSTNGQLLDEKVSTALIDAGLTRLIICMDGVTQDVYQEHRRNGDLAKLINNIKVILEIRSKKRSRYPKVTIQMIVTKKNQHEIKAFEKLVKDIGVDGAYLMSLFIDRTADPEFVKKIESDFFVEPGKKGLSRYYVAEDGSMNMYENDTDCSQEAKYPIVTTDGDLVECCYDIFLKNIFGNVEKNSFVKLWERDAYKMFRESIMMKRKLAICKNCAPKNREWTHRLF